MPHGETWFSLFGFHGSFADWARQAFGESYLEQNANFNVHHVIGYAMVVGLLILIGFWVRARIGKPEDHILPEGRVTFYGFIEMLVGATYKISADIMGAKPAKYFLPLIGTCALVIFFSNVLGLIPGFLPPTDNLNTTFAMAIVIFFATHIYGIREQGAASYFKHFLPPRIPVFGKGASLPARIPAFIGWLILSLLLLIVVPLIELISHIIRPVTLAIRLMANMTADHLVLGIFVGLFAGSIIIPFTDVELSFFWLPVPVVFYVLGCLVVTVQTLVFCILSIIYIALAIETQEH